jgi:zinc/manganese transport system substrate-binding protein
LSIVAAEGFYGDIARQVAGPEVPVASILANPDQDPHLFEATPSVAREVAGASVVIYNGLDYDPWMPALLAASPSPGRIALVAADLSGRTVGANPHIWFDPATMRAVATALANAMAAKDPSHAAAYRARLGVFEASLVPIEARIAAIRRRVAGLRVTATEPLAGDIFRALGLDIENVSFQRAVMNSAEPAPSEVAAFETSLRTRQVQLLLYNSQATNPIADRMVRIARAAEVPVMAATETQPAGVSWQAWIGAWLDSLDHLLGPQ